MFSLRKKLGLRTLRLAQENTNAGSFHNIRSLLQIIVATTLLIESIGAILLSLRFVPKYGAHGVWVAIFTSVSAYCNAGFDILGNETPFGSLIHYNGDVIVLYTVMALIFLGRHLASSVFRRSLVLLAQASPLDAAHQGHAADERRTDRGRLFGVFGGGI